MITTVDTILQRDLANHSFTFGKSNETHELPGKTFKLYTDPIIIIDILENRHMDIKGELRKHFDNIKQTVEGSINGEMNFMGNMKSKVS